MLLEDQMDALAAAEINGINISIDTLNPKTFAEITRRDVFSQVYKGIQKALTYPEISVKLNCLPLGLEEQNLEEIAELAKDNMVHVRFIEVMPIGQGKNYKFLSETQIINMLEKKFGKMAPFGEVLGHGPGHYYSIEGFRGKIGFISAISHKFCGTCNRIRLTAEGYLKSCLQYDTGRDLRFLLRNGATDEEIKDAIVQGIEEKPIEHIFLSGHIDQEENHTMSQIGG
jgi:cyclic pyranopterin phosphate synthase